MFKFYEINCEILNAFFEPWHKSIASVIGLDRVRVKCVREADLRTFRRESWYSIPEDRSHKGEKISRLLARD